MYYKIVGSWSTHTNLNRKYNKLGISKLYYYISAFKWTTERVWFPEGSSSLLTSHEAYVPDNNGLRNPSSPTCKDYRDWFKMSMELACPK